MDYKETFLRITPTEVEKESQVDHEHLLVLLREALRYNDIDTANQIIEGVPVFYDYKGKEYFKHIGGLTCYPPSTEFLIDKIVLKLEALLEDKTIDFYSRVSWMYTGILKRVPKFIKGPKRNSILIKYFKQLLKGIDHTVTIKNTTRSKTCNPMAKVIVNIYPKIINNETLDYEFTQENSRLLMDVLDSIRYVYINPILVEDRYYTLNMEIYYAWVIYHKPYLNKRYYTGCSEYINYDCGNMQPKPDKYIACGSGIIGKIYHETTIENLISKSKSRRR
jgi:hypothetical protein